MNKYLKIAIVAVIIIGVFVFSLLVSGKQPVTVISYDDYNKISSDEGFVYYGSKEDIGTLREIAKSADIEIGLLDSEESKTEKLDEGKLYQYEDGKLVFKSSAKIDSYKLTEELMHEDIIDKTYLTITLDDYMKIIKSKGYNFMFIGSEQCGYCQEFKKSITESLEGNDYNVYYLDISTLNEDEIKELTATDNYFSENEWGTPLNLLYKNGKRVDVLNGYVDSNELVQFLKKNKVI